MEIGFFDYSIWSVYNQALVNGGITLSDWRTDFGNNIEQSFLGWLHHQFDTTTKNGIIFEKSLNFLKSEVDTQILL